MQTYSRFLKDDSGEEYARYAANNPNYDYDRIDSMVDDESFTGWTLIKGGGWKLGKLDDNAVVADPFGNTHTIKELYDAIVPFAGKDKAKAYLVALQQKVGAAKTVNWIW